MIERKFIAKGVNELQIQEYIGQQLGRVGYSKIEIKKTPLGEKIVVHTSRPGMIVGKKGENIRKLTALLKNKFGLENPQIEIAEITDPMLDANNVAESIAYTFERYGSKRFKYLGYETLKRIIAAGAIGAEIIISGTVPSARAKKWKFYEGYLKRSGDVSSTKVRRATTTAILKRGAIGIKVAIMPPDIVLPDTIKILSPKEVIPEPEREVQKKKPRKAVQKNKKTTEKQSDEKKDNTNKIPDKQEVKPDSTN
ncbi:MAG: 30S ribosomal protein S3 [Nanoarchaeota archaeon]